MTFLMPGLVHKDNAFTYSRINFTKCPALTAGNFGEPRLMSQVGRMCEVVCA